MKKRLRQKRERAVLMMIWKDKDEQLLRFFNYKLKKNEIIAKASTSEKMLSIASFDEFDNMTRFKVDRKGRIY